MPYELIADGGEWVSPRHRGFKLQCCDCGLVHTWEFRVVDGAVQFRLKQDARASAGVRRRTDLPFIPRR